MKYRGNHICNNNCNSFFRLYITMRSNESVRGDGNNEPSVSITMNRERFGGICMRRIFGK